MYAVVMYKAESATLPWFCCKTGGGESLLDTGSPPNPDDINMDYYSDELAHIV